MSFFLISHPLTTLKKTVEREIQVVWMWRIFYKKITKNPFCKGYLISCQIHQWIILFDAIHGVIYNDRKLKNVWHILSIFIVGHYAYLKHNVELLLAKLFALVYDSKEKTILKNISYILLYYSLCIEMNFLYLSSFVFRLYIVMYFITHQYIFVLLAKWTKRTWNNRYTMNQ